MIKNRRHFKLERLEKRDLPGAFNPGSPNMSNSDNYVAIYSAQIIENGNSAVTPFSVSEQATTAPGFRADQVQSLLASTGRGHLA